jgi:hypothetical protein
MQEPTLGYPGAALFQAIHTHRNLLSGTYPGTALFQAINTLRTGTYSHFPGADLF